MITSNKPPLRSARVTPPGRIIERELEARGWDQLDLAKIMQRPVNAVNEIIAAKKRITPETAHELGAAFGVEAAFWSNLEANYRLRITEDEESEARIAKRRDLYERYPIRELQKRGWIEETIEPIEIERSLAGLLGSSNPMQYPAWSAPCYRGSEKLTPEIGSRVAWVARVRYLAKQQKCAKFESKNLEALVLRLLELTLHENGVRDVQKTCAESGVHCVFVQALPKSHVDGAAFTLSGRPVIALSLRYQQLDRFWFTLFHELAHIVFGHTDVLCEEINAEHDKEAIDEQEQQANQWASERLIPPNTFQDFTTIGEFSRGAIEQFAAKIARHPAIVLGRLQFDQVIPWGKMNQLQPNVRGLLEL